MPTVIKNSDIGSSPCLAATILTLIYYFMTGIEQVIETFQANDAGLYISQFINSAKFIKAADPAPVQAYSGLIDFDSAIYLNKIASHIGHISQLSFRILPESGYVEVKSVPVIGAVSHLSSDILDIKQYSNVVWENGVNAPALKRDLEDLYNSSGYALGLTLKTYQMSQYAVINQAVARMGGPFFGYASVCLETAKKLYELGEVNQCVDLLEGLRGHAKIIQEVFSDPRIINSYLLPVPMPFAKLTAIGLGTGIGLFLTMNMGKLVPLLM